MYEQEIIREHFFLKKMSSSFLLLFLLPGKSAGVGTSARNEPVER